MAGPGKNGLLKKALGAKKFSQQQQTANNVEGDLAQQEAPASYVPPRQQNASLPQHPVTRKSSRRTPTKAQPAFQLRDDEEVQPPSQLPIPRRSARLSPHQPSPLSDGQTAGSNNVRADVRRSLLLETPNQNQSLNSTPQSNHLSNEIENVSRIQGQDNSGSTSDCTRGRGVTRNLRCCKKLDPNKPLTIEVDWEYGRLIGKDSQTLITGGGCVMRQFAEFDGKSWTKQDDTVKKEIFEKLADGTDYDGNADVGAIILRQLGCQFRNKQYHLHKVFLSYGSMDEALKNVPTGLSKEEWTGLCQKFTDPDWLAKSAKNKANREANKAPPGNGSKSLARHVHEQKQQGKRVSEIDAYEFTHFSTKKGKMVNDIAQENLNAMRETESSSSQSTSEIWSSLMPNKPPPGHVKGRAVPQKQFHIARIMQEQLEKEKKRAEEAEQRAACIVEQMAAQKEELTSLKEEQSRTNAKMDLLLEEFARITRGH